MTGWSGRAVLTAERFVPDAFAREEGARLYRTGDLVCYLPDGQLEFKGRGDEQLKIRGLRIEPGEIEAALSLEDCVREAAVLARTDDGGQRLVAYVAAEPGRGVSPEVLRRGLRERLPEYMIPSAFVMLEELPRLSSGKVDRRALPAPDAARPEAADAYVAPLDAVEELLVRVWAEVLRAERVGVHDNFFELGGDSILSIQIVGKVNRAGLSLQVQQIFQYPTIPELAHVINISARQSEAKQGAAAGDVPLTPIELRFFEQRLSNPHHYSQAAMLASDSTPDAHTLRLALSALVSHRDALRLRFTSAEHTWRQFIQKAIVDGATCVMIFPDRGERYLDTIYSDVWVKEHFGDVSHHREDAYPVFDETLVEEPAVVLSTAEVAL